ncbi:glutamate-gated chloride channel-like isoform X2 [Uloborus diversus]|uniref:glutamate-gated chloride channel-like isoform X2 n=1 Tax=Uloborus diversus TaxID=327109 RepID=UPI002409F2B3|nr:glutamate-gated chloride channel-like isoform X2 [Uloborus diversus]
MKEFFLTCFLLIASSFHFTNGKGNLYLEQKILKDIFKEYDSSVRPEGKNGSGPVVVTVNTYVRSITNINDVNMEYDVQLTFRQSWMDSRLKYDSGLGLTYLTLTKIEHIWTPDLFFSNEMSGQFHFLLTPNTLIRIYPDGKILYSTRISMKLFCPMDLRNYPMDNQICSLKAASYAYTTEDLVFLWKDTEPIQVTKTLSQIPKFTMNSFNEDYCTSKTTTGEYSCIQLDFHFSREFTFYLIQAYMPSLALVLLSWVIFWLRPLTLRLGVWVGLLVALMLVTAHVGDQSPQVSYVKALDVWMGSCVCFLFCVLLEICAVSNALSGDEGLDETLAENSMGVEEKGGKGDRGGRLTSYASTPLKWLNRYSTRAQRIDAVSRVLFPATFAFFNFVYWITYAA